VSQVLADPRAFGDAIVRIPGRADLIGEHGFVLAGDERAIFGGAPASELRSLEPGQRVLLDAELARISRFRAEMIASILSRREAEDVNLDRVPGRPGGPYLVLPGIRR
jgi:hypothetical protein